MQQRFLEVETLDADQINHLKDHGTLPERPYDNNGDEDQKRLLNRKHTEQNDENIIQMQQVHHADPSIGDLPKEEGFTREPQNPIQEERRD